MWLYFFIFLTELFVKISVWSSRDNMYFKTIIVNYAHNILYKLTVINLNKEK